MPKSGRKRGRPKKGVAPPRPARTGLFAAADDLRPRIGRPRFQPTEADRRYVKQMAQLGIPHEDIAATVGISRNTLTLHFREDLDDGRIEAEAAVASSLFAKATAKTLSGASVRAAEIWLKRRAHWLEARQPREEGDKTGENEVVVTGGLPPQPRDDDEPGGEPGAGGATGGGQ